VPNRQAVLAERYRDALIDVRKRVSARVDRNWRDLGSWNEADVDRFLARTLPVVDAGQRRTVSLTDAYLARATGRRTLGLVADNLVGAAVRNGTDPATVYTRPFVQLWSGLSDGQQFSDALNAAGVRAASSASMDVSLTMRASADAFEKQAAADPGPIIIGWERVVDPNACDFCVLIADRVYYRADLLPVHNNCHCSVEPVVYGKPRAFDRLNAPQVDRLKERQAAGESIPEPAVHEHGELGAVLADAAHSFTKI
jgi:hypothetical protein